MKDRGRASSNFMRESFIFESCLICRLPAFGGRVERDPLGPDAKAWGVGAPPGLPGRATNLTDGLYCTYVVRDRLSSGEGQIAT